MNEALTEVILYKKYRKNQNRKYKQKIIFEKNLAKCLVSSLKTSFPCVCALSYLSSVEKEDALLKGNLSAKK